MRRQLIVFMFFTCLACSAHGQTRTYRIDFEAVKRAMASSQVAPAVIRACRYQSGDLATRTKPVLCQRMALSSNGLYQPLSTAFWAKAPEGFDIPTSEGFVLFETGATGSAKPSQHTARNSGWDLEAIADAGRRQSREINERGDQRAAEIQDKITLLQSTLLGGVARRSSLAGTVAGSASSSQSSRASTSTETQVGSATSSVFDALPSGVGTPQQRTFWQSRCQGHANDNSAAAAGCRETLSFLNSKSTQTTVSPSAANSKPAAQSTGVVIQSTPAQVATKVHCVSMEEDKGSGLGFWKVVNNCSFRVSGSFWYTGGKQSLSKEHPGGFGPIGVGRFETVSAPDKGVERYGIHACKYEEWLSGVCKQH